MPSFHTPDPDDSPSLLAKLNPQEEVAVAKIQKLQQRIKSIDGEIAKLQTERGELTLAIETQQKKCRHLNTTFKEGGYDIPLRVCVDCGKAERA